MTSNLSLTDDEEERGNLNVGQILDVANRHRLGLPITDSERAQLDEADQAIGATIRKWQEHSSAVLERWREPLSKIPNLLAQVGQAQQQWIKHVAPIVGQIAIAVRDFPPKLQVALQTMGAHGWYLDGQMGLSYLWDLQRLLQDGQTGKVDSLLAEHYEKRLPAIEKHLIEVLPSRQAILQSALSAHRRGEYDLSVPVLLAQADGACVDLAGGPLFIKDRSTKKPLVLKLLGQECHESYATAILAPLEIVLPINASFEQRERLIEEQGLQGWRELNRHLVLHGESVDYGTHINSLKAVSLINYLADAIPAARDRLTP